MADHENENDSPNPPERRLWFGVVGAVLGGVVGYFAFFALLQKASIYALVIPGGLIGLGRGLGARSKSIPLGIACGAGALAISLWIEYQITPGAEDGGGRFSGRIARKAISEPRIADCRALFSLVVRREPRTNGR
jgi:hypothetical protein